MTTAILLITNIVEIYLADFLLKEGGAKLWPPPINILIIVTTAVVEGNIVSSHLAGPGSIPGRVIFPGWDKCQKNLGPIYLRISLAIKIINKHSLRVPMTSNVDAP